MKYSWLSLLRSVDNDQDTEKEEESENTGQVKDNANETNQSIKQRRVIWI